MHYLLQSAPHFKLFGVNHWLAPLQYSSALASPLVWLDHETVLNPLQFAKSSVADAGRFARWFQIF